MSFGIQLTEVSEERCFAAHESGLQLLRNVVEVLKRELRVVYGPELEVWMQVKEQQVIAKNSLLIEHHEPTNLRVLHGHLSLLNEE